MALLDAAVACAKAGLAAPLLATLVWLLAYGTRRWTDDAAWARFPPDFGCDDSKVLDSCTRSQIAWLLLPPALIGAFAIPLLYLSARADRGAAHGGGAEKPPPRREGRLRRALRAQLPPARFWAWWCGGISGADAAVVALWLAVNAIWLAAILKRYYSLAPILSRLAHTPRWAIEAELTAIGFGALLFPNLLLLFYPVSRGSALLQATGVSYPAAIRYHRWLGHWVMVLVTAHSLGFWGVWAILGVWREEALSFGSRVNNLMGGLSFLFGLALWVTSLEAARRRAYSLFYAVHHIGFWGFTLAGLMHYSSMFWYFVPGMLFYAVDAAFRLTQALGRRAVVISAEAPCGGQASVCSLVLEAPAYAVAPTGFVWLQVPEISRTQWHPFEYSAVSHPSGAAGPGCAPRPAMLIHAKAYDRWTRRLVQAVKARGAALAVRAEGPYADAPAWTQRAGDDGAVIAAGGIGVAAALSLFEEMPPSPLLPVLLIWSARHPAELLLLAPRVLAAARARGVALAAHVHYTGDPRDLSEVSEAEAGATPKAAATTASHACVSSAAAAGERADAASHEGTSPLCPVVALGGSLGAQAAHKLAAHALACAGALGSILLVRALSTVWAPEPWPVAATGAAYVAAFALGASLPGVLLVLAAPLFGRAQHGGGGGGADEPLLAGAPSEGDAGAAGAPLARAVVGAAGGWSLLLPPAAPGAEPEALPLRLGRPELPGLFSAWLASLKQLPAGAVPGSAQGAGHAQAAGACGAREAGPWPQVGCYAMGPAGLLSEVQLLCHDINRGAAGGPGGGKPGAGGRGPYVRYVCRTHNL